MIYRGIFSLAGALAVFALVPGAACAQERSAAQMGPPKTEAYHATYLQLGDARLDAVLYEPNKGAVNPRVAVVFSNPLNLGFLVPATELAARGYRVVFVTHHAGPNGGIQTAMDGIEETSRAITYLRSLPGVERVVIVGWGAGGSSMALYANIAEHGPAACQNPATFVPCKTADATGKAAVDGLILLDPGLGAASQVNDVDPAYDGTQRSRTALDMFAPANGYDPARGAASYSAAFRRSYYAAQSIRNNGIVEQTVARLRQVEAGQGPFRGDEPFSGIGLRLAGSGASLHNTDRTILAHTRGFYTLLKSDGTTPTVQLQSVRPLMSGVKTIGRVNPCCTTTLRSFLEMNAIRTKPEFVLTEDNIDGIDWKSSNTSTPGQVEGVTVPTLIMAMTCWEFVVPAEVVYSHLASQDKTLVGVEGANHDFGSCAAQYADPKRQMFDYIAGWLGKPGRF